MVRGTRWLATETGRQVRATTTQLQRTLQRLQRQGRRLVRLGHAAVGTQSVDEAALRQTVDTLSTVDEVLAELPLVYRRLFSFRPIQDPDLLVARASDQAAVEQHVERWKRGLTNALVLTGPAGSGRTSLLNVLRKTSFRTAQRHTIELTERVTNEAAFAELVVRELSLSVDPDGPLSLDAVAEHLQSQPVPNRLRVCFIEEFEHVFHRTVNGTALGARILDFLSETDTRVLWIATTTDASWQFVTASEPAAARLVARHSLDPLDRAELEELIMTRHRRSGLGLTFEMPDETSYPILSRRLRAIDDEERRQTLLRAEFFDRLHDVCGQNVMLALFYWFRSVTLDVDAAALRVRPLEPVSFEVLDTLPLPHAFALKALLEHGTLTVDELAEVLGVAPATGRSLLETLGNALVIAPAERVEGPGVFQFASIEYETRYRIRPLLIHPVTRFLRSRNIVH
jgi:type II secretory pathway predicted ATPase ExeA